MLLPTFILISTLTKLTYTRTVRRINTQGHTKIQQNVRGETLEKESPTIQNEETIKWNVQIKFSYSLSSLSHTIGHTAIPPYHHTACAAYAGNIPGMFTNSECDLPCQPVPIYSTHLPPVYSHIHTYIYTHSESERYPTVSRLDVVLARFSILPLMRLQIIDNKTPILSPAVPQLHSSD